jgi:predicted MFS family arabinose efflux permease
LFQFVTYACFFNLTPLYPAVGQDLGLDAGALGALIGIGGAVAVLVQVPAGSGGDAIGRRPFFGAAMVLLLLGQLARWQAQSATALLVAQVLAGAALGIAGVTGWALVADLSRSAPGGPAAGQARGNGQAQDRRPARARRQGQGQAFGILNASLSLGLVGGYIFAGLVGGGVGWRAESLAIGVLPLLSLAVVATVPGRAAPGGSRSAGLAVVLGSLAHRRRLALAGVAALTLSAGQGAVYLLPFSLSRRDFGPQTAALLLVPYVVGSVVAAPLGGRLGDRFGPRPVILAGLVTGMAACVSLVWLADTTPLLVACFILIGGAINGSLPLVAVRVVRMGDTAGVGMGTVIAGLRMGQSLGSFLGPLIGGFVLAHAGLDAGWLAQAACLLGALALHELGSR